MEELKYCRICLVTGVKMYSLHSTSHDSIGEIYLHLAQIRVPDRNQHVCFECASLLLKYQVFKSKCLRAHKILSNISVNSTMLINQVINNIDRTANKLASNLKMTETELYFIHSNDCTEAKTHSTIPKTDFEEHQVKIESEVQTILIHEEYNPNYSLRPLTLKENIYLKNEIKELAFSEPNDNKYEKEQNTKKNNMSNEVLTTESHNPFNGVNASLDSYNDDDFIVNSPVKALEEAEESINVKYKATPKKQSKPKRVKKTTVQSDDDFSDNEPLSKRVTKSHDKKDKGFNKKYKYRFGLEFFTGYATVEELTPDDARKELLSRKESKNYKISPFKCDFCFKGYEVKTAYENHMKRHDEENGDYECELCHLRFPKPLYLCKHKLSCHKRKFSCKLCSYICNSMSQARAHVSLHKGEKYTCTDCGEMFSMRNSLFMHKRTKHLKVAENVCELCGDTFGSARGLYLHYKKLHRKDKNSKQGPKCEECNAHFSSEAAWKRHLVLSTRHKVINGCKYCGERFANLDDLNSHKREQHRRIQRKKPALELPASCPICKKWLTNLLEYNTHVKTDHPQSDEAKELAANDLAAFVCEVCGQAFKQQCFLTYHQRKHTGERPYKCDDCGKTFQMPGSLSIHRTVHTHKPKYKCDLCTKAFASKSSLNKHMKLHLGIRPHKCTICDKGFLHMCDLRLHIKCVHDKVPWPKKKNKRNATDNSQTYVDYN